MPAEQSAGGEHSRQRPGRRRSARRWITGAACLAALTVIGFLALREPTVPAELLAPAPPALAANDAAGAGLSLVVQEENPGIERLGATWYFNWHFVPHDDVDLPFVPLVCGYPGDRQVTDSHLDEVEETISGNPGDYPDGTLFLLGNEIGYTHQKDGRSPREYAADFRRCSELLRSINPTFLVSVGPTILSTDPGITAAIVDAEDGLDYLDQVITEYESAYGEPIPADYFAATNHALAVDEEHLRMFEEGMVDLRRLLAEAGLRDAGVILTEFGVPTRGSTAEDIEWFMGEAIRIVATASDPAIGHPSDGRLVQRHAWFTTRPLTPIHKLQSLGFGAFFLQLAQTSLHNNQGEPTHLGRLYAIMVGGDSEVALPGAAERQPREVLAGNEAGREL